MDGKIGRRLKRIAIVVFENLLALQCLKVHFVVVVLYVDIFVWQEAVTCHLMAIY